MQYNPYTFNSQERMHATSKSRWDVDFIRAKFNVSAREVEQAIKHVGYNVEKVVEYLRTAFRKK